MDDTPPFSVSLSFDDQENDDRSELTWRSDGDENSQEEGDADPDYCNALDETHPTHHSEMHQARTSSRGDQILTDSLPLQRNERQELIHSKLRIAQLKEKLDILSSKLRQSQAENEALKAEKTSLIDELVIAKDTNEERSFSSLTRGFSMRGFGTGVNVNGGSMQMLLDTNAKLMTENARLQVSEDSVRDSFQSYIRISLRSSRADRGMIETLKRENELLQLQLQQRRSVTKNVKLDLSEHTAKTSLEHSDTEKYPEDLPIGSSQHSHRDSMLANSLHSNIGSSQHSHRDSMLTNSLHSIPEQEFKFGTPGVDWVTEGEDIPASNIGAISNKDARRNSMPITSEEIANTFGKGVTRSKSEALLVDFGEVAERRMCHSLTEGTAGSKSEIETETRRPRRRSGGLWSSLIG